MPKDPKAWSKATADYTVGGPYVMMRETPYAHVMVPANHYYKHREKSSPMAVTARFSAFGHPLFEEDGTPTTTAMVVVPLLFLSTFGLVGLAARLYGKAKAKSSE